MTLPIRLAQITAPRGRWLVVEALPDNVLAARGYNTATSTFALDLMPGADAERLLHLLRHPPEDQGETLRLLASCPRRGPVPPIDLDARKGLADDVRLAELERCRQAIDAVAPRFGLHPRWSWSGGLGVHGDLDAGGFAHPDLYKIVGRIVRRMADAAGVPLMSGHEPGTRPAVCIDDTIFNKSAGGRGQPWRLLGATGKRGARKIRIGGTPDGAPVDAAALRRARDEIEEEEAKKEARRIIRSAFTRPESEHGVETWPRVPSCPVCGHDRCRVRPDGKKCWCYREGRVVSPGATLSPAVVARIVETHPCPDCANTTSDISVEEEERKAIEWEALDSESRARAVREGIAMSPLPVSGYVLKIPPHGAPPRDDGTVPPKRMAKRADRVLNLGRCGRARRATHCHSTTHERPQLCKKVLVTCQMVNACWHCANRRQAKILDARAKVFRDTIGDHVGLLLVPLQVDRDAVPGWNGLASDATRAIKMMKDVTRARKRALKDWSGNPAATSALGAFHVGTPAPDGPDEYLPAAPWYRYAVMVALHPDLMDRMCGHLHTMGYKSTPEVLPVRRAVAKLAGHRVAITGVPRNDDETVAHLEALAGRPLVRPFGMPGLERMRQAELNELLGRDPPAECQCPLCGDKTNPGLLKDTIELPDGRTLDLAGNWADPLRDPYITACIDSCARVEPETILSP